jgi:hypothetical protein
MKPQFEIDVEDETLRRMKWDNPDINDEYDFNLIYKEVKNKILNYSSVIAKYDSDYKIKKYEESEEFKSLVYRETVNFIY